MIKEAKVSKCGKFRWTLTRVWDPNLPMACYIGHNPSRADGSVEDPTTLAWAHFARVNGFGGYLAVNQYPFRSSDPKECRRWADFQSNGPDWYARDVLMDNRDLVAEVAKKAGIVVACWGALAQDEVWTESIIEAIQCGEPPYPDIYCLGVTASGAPKHPMARGWHRIARDQKFIPWRPAEPVAAPEQKDPV